MPFWKKDKKDSNGDSSENSNNGTKEKINYKARLEHKLYLVRDAMPSLFICKAISCALS